jgi:hypothetical protein
MPRHNHLADQRRWALPVPPEMRERQGLVIDVRVMRIICPWPPKRRKRSRGITLLSVRKIGPYVVGDGRGRHGEARFADRGCSYD